MENNSDVQKKWKIWKKNRNLKAELKLTSMKNILYEKHSSLVEIFIYQLGLC